MSDEELAPVSSEMTSLEGDIERIRGRLDRVMGELDHRRHKFLDVGRYKWVLIGVGAVAATSLGAALIVPRLRKRRLSTWRQKLPISLSLGRKPPPESQTHAGSAALKVLLAVATGAAPIVGRYLAKRLVEPKAHHH